MLVYAQIHVLLLCAIIAKMNGKDQEITFSNVHNAINKLNPENSIHLENLLEIAFNCNVLSKIVNKNSQWLWTNS